VNARDARPGGGTLTIETLNATMSEAAVPEHPGSQSGPHVRIRVRDTGSGISNESMDRIFEPFFTTKPVGKGTGLGLATVYGIVSQAGGHVRVESQPGQGTVFDVWIPRAEGPEATATVELQETDLRGTETILVCEDEDMVRDLACRILRSVGFKVLHAENGKRALELVQRCADPIDLLLTDTVMPEMSGIELAEQLSKTQPRMKVLFVSGYAPEELASDGVLDVCVELLPKPFSATDLIKRVRGVLDSRGLDAGPRPAP
jgi:two-component system cell cycle sensor histidine kinase/response regulator CckA